MTLRNWVPLLLLLGAPTPAFGAGDDGLKSIVHKVTDQGEGYADIAEHYYGKRFFERHLRLVNRRPEPLDKASIVLIPTLRYVSMKKGETLEDIAKEHLLDARRADYLAELIGTSRPKPGQSVPVVSSVNHVVRPGESLRSIARMYYRDASNRRLKLLMLYNKLSSDKVKKSVRIPLDTPEFSRDTVLTRARQTFVKPTLVAERPDPPPSPTPAPPPPKKRTSGPSSPPPSKRNDAQDLEEALDAAERLYDEGEYERCARIARRELAGADSGPLEPKVELLRIEASALVALGRVPESRARFKELLNLDPKYELDLYRTSPKILDVFETVAER